MTKKELNVVLERLATEIMVAHNGLLGESGARAVLGAAIREHRAQIVGFMASGSALERAQQIAEGSLEVAYPS